MGRLGVTELILIAVIAILLFGAGRLAEIGRGLGEGIRNFKKGISDDREAVTIRDPGRVGAGAKKD
jgi:sec-independent protein translocase protein TatA